MRYELVVEQDVVEIHGRSETGERVVLGYGFRDRMLDQVIAVPLHASREEAAVALHLRLTGGVG